MLCLPSVLCWGWWRMVWTSIDSPMLRQRGSPELSSELLSGQFLRPRSVFAELNHFSSRTVCCSSQAYVKSRCGLLTRVSQYLIFSYKGSLLKMWPFSWLCFPNGLKGNEALLLRAELGLWLPFHLSERGNFAMVILISLKLLSILQSSGTSKSVAFPDLAFGVK